MALRPVGFPLRQVSLGMSGCRRCPSNSIGQARSGDVEDWRGGGGEVPLPFFGFRELLWQFKTGATLDDDSHEFLLQHVSHVSQLDFDWISIGVMADAFWPVTLARCDASQ